MATGKETTRRAFLKKAAVSALGFSIVPRHVLGGPGFVPPSEKVNVAISVPAEWGCATRRRC